ncbi:hypothetical protein [Streptomyces hoynatensis]|uniref:YtxH domain-containing protein n=1 Tax=Streptomyces hoynatensis TaxID=1141874 RepID=A0A3A9ZCA0_9ACTN|nr:hypothetical protein [Streptomyces hoynatensis]RKN45739.1 hypothetical protein D7294_04565 [Streptomyces hoynatensis]
MHKLTFAAGAAVGYVLGARAGRERYEQLREAAQRLMQSPAVRNGMDTAAQTGRQAAAVAAGAVADRAGDRLPGAMTERLRAVRDHGNSHDASHGTSQGNSAHDGDMAAR